MGGREFFEKVQQHDDLDWLGVHEGGTPSGDSVCVRHRPTEADWELPVAELLAEDWEWLESVLTGKRQPELLSHLTRIVGYYSRVKDWNPSKVSELRDRGKVPGAYTVPEKLPRFSMSREADETSEAIVSECPCRLVPAGKK